MPANLFKDPHKDYVRGDCFVAALLAMTSPGVECHCERSEAISIARFLGWPIAFMRIVVSLCLGVFLDVAERFW